MEFEKTADEMEFGFPTIPAGRYLWQIESVDLVVNENTGSKGYDFVYIVDEIIDAEGTDVVGHKFFDYVNVITKKGDENPIGGKVINAIINMTGLFEAFSKKFEDGFNLDDAKLATALSLKLQGKFIDMTHTVSEETGDDGVVRNKITITHRRLYKKGAGGGKKKPAPAKDTENDDGETDW